MAKNVTVQSSTQADIPKITAFLASTIGAATSAAHLSSLVRDGKSVVAKTKSGEVVGHSSLFVGREGEAFYTLVAVKQGYPELQAEMEGALKRILRPNVPEFQDYLPLPGTCDK